MEEEKPYRPLFDVPSVPVYKRENKRFVQRVYLSSLTKAKDSGSLKIR